MHVTFKAGWFILSSDLSFRNTFEDIKEKPQKLYHFIKINSNINRF